MQDRRRQRIFVIPEDPRPGPVRQALKRAGYRLVEPADAEEAYSVVADVDASLYLIEAFDRASAERALAALARDRHAARKPALIAGGPAIGRDDALALYQLGAADVFMAPQVPELALARIGALLRLQREVEKARELSVRDELTGLYNRRHFFERLEQELARARRTRTTVGLVSFDVDLFKKVNDTWGHLVGDEVLRVVARTAEQHTRRSDLVARMGGDEFALLLGVSSLEGARICAEGLRRRLEVAPFPLPAGVPVTISVGVAAWPGPRVADPADDLLRVADEALLEAKRLGRNRVVVAGS